MSEQGDEIKKMEKDLEDACMNGIGLSFVLKHGEQGEKRLEGMRKNLLDSIFGIVEQSTKPEDREKLVAMRNRIDDRVGGMVAASKEIDRLAAYLTEEWGEQIGLGNPAQGESAVDMVIRLLTEYKEELQGKK